MLLLLLLFLITRQLTPGTACAIRLQAITTMLLIQPTLQNHHHHQCAVEFHIHSARRRFSKAPRSSSSKSSIFAPEKCGLLWHFPPVFLKCDYPHSRQTLTHLQRCKACGVLNSPRPFWQKEDADVKEDASTVAPRKCSTEWYSVNFCSEVLIPFRFFSSTPSFTLINSSASKPQTSFPPGVPIQIYACPWYFVPAT
jgi:hypothetical protein